MAGGYCVWCGHPVAPDTTFCTQCGSAVGGGKGPAVAATPIPGAVAADTQGGRPEHRRGFFRSAVGIGLIAAVVVVVAIFLVLATIPVSQTRHFSASISGGVNGSAVFDWAWSFPSGVRVAVTWSGPSGSTSNLSVVGLTNAPFYQSGTSGNFSFSAGPHLYSFQMTVVGVDIQGWVLAAASYQTPIL